jgi:hypothetical protein
VALVLLYPYIW